MKVAADAPAAEPFSLGANFPYRSVEVSLPDGSYFRVSTDAVARLTAKRLGHACPLAGEQALLQNQVIPCVLETPALLLEFAARLPWDEVFAQATGAWWSSHPSGLKDVFRHRAHMSLSTCL